MMLNKFVLYVLVTFLSIGVVKAQDYYFRHHKVEDGLSHDTVLCSLQDSKGFLWFGTKDGLNRLDGYSFKHYRKDPSKTNSLGSNFIECIKEYKGKLYVGTDSGLYVYNDTDDSFSLVESSSNKPILDIESDHQGNIWFAGGSTLNKHHIESGKSESYENEKFRTDEITKTPNGTIWVASQNILRRFNHKTNAFTEYQIDAETKDNQPIIISKIYSYTDNEILIGTQKNGVFIYTIDDNRVESFLYSSEKHIYVRDIILNESGNLWIATESGIYIHNPENSSFTHLTKSFNNPYALSDNAVYSLTVDKEGGVWASTYFGGVNYYRKQFTPFKKYFPKLGENSISGNAVREIHSDNYNNLWIGTEDAGLNKLNLNTGRFTNYLPSKDKNSIAHYNIHGLLLKEDKLFIGTFDNGLDVMDIKTGEVIDHYNTINNSTLSSDFMYSFYENSNEDVFVITSSHIQLFDYKKKVFSSTNAFPEGYFYTSLLQEKDSILWAGTYWEGLFYFDSKTNTRKIFKHDHTNPKSLSSNAINGIYQDNKGKIWITTENGLNEFVPETNSFVNYTTKDGFPSNVTYSILEDDENNLWISTSKGLVKFNTTTKATKTYTKANGLLSDQFNYNSAYKQKDGTMFFGSFDGMISFNPKEFKKNTYKAPIYITNILIDNKELEINNLTSLRKKSKSLVKEIVLEPQNSSLQIDFSALSFNSPEMTEYWYKLEGLNNDWFYLGKNHSVSFVGLTPGDYSFKVKSKNSDGQLSEESLNLQILALPTFWNSNYAYILYILILSMIIYLLAKNYHARIKVKNQQMISDLDRIKDKELYEAKIDFFTTISHEIRTPLTLIKNPLEKILKRNDYDDGLTLNLSIMNKNVSRLLNLVNQLLDFRKSEIEGINLTFINTNITRLIQNIHTRFSQEIINENFKFELNLGDEDFYAFADVEALEKIISNLLSNAIKYADKEISISLIKKDDIFKLVLKNDGEIIPFQLRDKIFEPYFVSSEFEKQSKTSTGIGLSLAHSLVELHKGSLKLDFEDSNMNSFILELPVRQRNKSKASYSKQEPKENKVVDKKSEEEPIKNIDQRPKLLLVEDNEDLLDFIAADLENQYQVLTSTSGKKALDILIEENVQLVLSDVMMPGMDGFALCDKIKTNIETSHIPVILLTAKASLTSKIEGLESGADAYIEKPFSIDHLNAQIKNLINNRDHIIEHYSSSPLAHVKSIAHTKTDEKFIKKLDKAIEDNMSDGDLNVEKLSELMNMSKSTFYRKVKNISNLSPNELINITRLKKASEYLKTGNYKIYEIAEMVGYNSQITLLRNFQKQFKMTPSEYLNSKKLD